VAKTIIKAFFTGLFFGSALAVGGAFVGFLLFFATVQCGWWGRPGGGIVAFPMVLIPAFLCGIYGFNLGVTRAWAKAASGAPGH
jgi:hypothetical protein